MFNLLFSIDSNMSVPRLNGAAELAVPTQNYVKYVLLRIDCHCPAYLRVNLKISSNTIRSLYLQQTGQTRLRGYSARPE